MRRFLGVAAVLAVAGMMSLAGCVKKEAVKAPENSQARQFLVEGTVFLKQGEVVKAVQSFATAIKVAPDYFEAYYMLAETFTHLKQFDQAQAVLVSAAGRFPDNPVTYYLLSVAYEGAGNLMPAIVAARKSLDLFQARKDEAGAQRATVLLGVLVQMARQESEAKMVDNAAREAASTAGQAVPAAAK